MLKNDLEKLNNELKLENLNKNGLNRILSSLEDRYNTIAAKVDSCTIIQALSSATAFMTGLLSVGAENSNVLLTSPQGHILLASFGGSVIAAGISSILKHGAEQKLADSKEEVDFFNDKLQESNDKTEEIKQQINFEKNDHFSKNCREVEDLLTDESKYEPQNNFKASEKVNPIQNNFTTQDNGQQQQ